jgi:superfamily II DNA/RNA helicase
VIIDEADEMLSMGFIQDRRRHIGELSFGTANGVIFSHHTVADFPTAKKYMDSRSS